MISEEFSFPSSEKGQTIYGRAYLPYGEVRGIVQFAHGMCDYGERYEELFRELTDCGFVAAYADHLGHGQSIRDEEDLGFFAHEDGYLKVVADFARFYDILDENFPNRKHFVMGHSMGSFIVRYFMSTYRKNMAGAVLMGTSGPNPLAGVGVLVAKAVALLRGDGYRSGLLEKMAFGSYNKRIEEPISPWAWLSRDQRMVSSFERDELRNRTFTASAFKDLFTLVHEVNLISTMEDTPKELPILLISGQEDPLGNYGKGIHRLEDTFSSIGLQDVHSVLLPGARHELCHEYDRDVMYETLIDWLYRRASRDIVLTFPAEEDPLDFENNWEDDEESEEQY